MKLIIVIMNRDTGKKFTFTGKIRVEVTGTEIHVIDRNGKEKTQVFPLFNYKIEKCEGFP